MVLPTDDLADILDEAKLVATVHARLARLDEAAAAHAGAIRTHIATFGARRSAVSGRALAEKRLTPASRARYDALLFFEKQLDDAEEAVSLDHSMLAMCGCQILEDQLGSMLVPIVRAGAPKLVELVAEDDRPTKVFRGWLDGAVPLTLGVLGAIAITLRRGLARSADASNAWLHGPTTAAFDTLLLSKGLEKAINDVRDRFRNPLAHATTTLDRATYRAFCALLVGGQDITSWDVRGPTPNPPAPNTAILHQVLACLA